MLIFIKTIAFLHVVTGFVSIHRVTDYKCYKNWARTMVATVEPLSSPKIEGPEDPVSWECDENANCVAVAACDEVQCRTSLDVRIHGKWYDLSGEFILPLFQYPLS